MAAGSPASPDEDDELEELEELDEEELLVTSPLEEPELPPPEDEDAEEVPLPDDAPPEELPLAAAPLDEAPGAPELLELASGVGSTPGSSSLEQAQTVVTTRPSQRLPRVSARMNAP